MELPELTRVYMECSHTLFTYKPFYRVWRYQSPELPSVHDPASNQERRTKNPPSLSQVDTDIRIPF